MWRRWAFSITLGMTGIFAIAAGGSMNYVTLYSLTAVWSAGVGGNLPADSAVFLGKQEGLHPVWRMLMRRVEFIPASHQYLLTVLSIWWAFGQLLGSLVRYSRDHCSWSMLTYFRLHSLLLPITLVPPLPPLLPAQSLQIKGGDISCSPWAGS
jgi:hypothetical protein